MTTPSPSPAEPDDPSGEQAAASRGRPLIHRAERLVILPVVLLVLFLGWEYLPLGDWLAPQRWMPVLRSLSESPWGGPAVVATFVAASLIVFPISILIAATAIAFGPWSGFIWALCGCVLGAAANFAQGRWLGKRLFANVAAQRFKAISARLARGGVVPVMVIRNLPVAPYTVVSIAAGASSIRLGDFLVGTALGTAPGIGALTFLGDRLRGVWQHPTPANIALVIAAIALWIGLAVGLQALSNRLRQR